MSGGFDTETTYYVNKSHMDVARLQLLFTSCTLDYIFKGIIIAINFFAAAHYLYLTYSP